MDDKWINKKRNQPRSGKSRIKHSTTLTEARNALNSALNALTKPMPTDTSYRESGDRDAVQEEAPSLLQGIELVCGLQPLAKAAAVARVRDGLSRLNGVIADIPLCAKQTITPKDEADIVRIDDLAGSTAVFRDQFAKIFKENFGIDVDAKAPRFQSTEQSIIRSFCAACSMLADNLERVSLALKDTQAVGDSTKTIPFSGPRKAR